MNDREWFYLRNGEKTGPVSLDELREMVATGKLKPSDSVWRAGMPQWAPAQTIPELFTSPPPPPHSPPPPPVQVNVMSPPAPKKSGTLKWLLIGGVLLVGGCCGIPGVIMMLAGVGHQVQQDEQAKKVATAPPLEVSLTDLVQAYKDNEVAADQKYKGRVVQVTGEVNDIKDGYIWLDSGVQFALYAYADLKDKSELAKLTKGQRITLKGICTGKGVLSSVNLGHCILIAK